MSTLELRQNLSKSGRIETLRNQLLRDQTLKHLLGEDGSDDPPAESDETET